MSPQNARRILAAVGLLAAQAPLASGEAETRPALVRVSGPEAGALDGIDQKALDGLVEGAEASHSDALVVLHGGKLVGEWYSGGKPRKIEAMSATKSIVNLAIGRLVKLGKIESVDQPVHAFFPEWKDGMKARVTLRHLLNHTSGLDADRTTEKIYASPDFVRFALDSELTHEPGTHFFYNNRAVNLLPGIFEKASGQKMHEHLRADLFAKLGITDFDWSLDPAGNPHGMSGFQVLPRDLARLGQLVLERGRWNGEQLIEASWIDLAFAAGSDLQENCGLLWWRRAKRSTYVIDEALLDEMREAGAKEEVLDKLRAGALGEYADDELESALEKALGKDFGQILVESLPRGMTPFRRRYHDFAAFEASGYLGQFLVVYPEAEIVAVRMIAHSDAYDQKTDLFRFFTRRVMALAP